MTELRVEPYELPAADLGPENPLPCFRSVEVDQRVGGHMDLPAKERKTFGLGTGRRVLPYRMQDGFGIVRKPRRFKSVVLENEILRATFLAELGGRMASLVYKPKKRELLCRNLVFQPASLAHRGAWISGGIEWNTCLPGHYYMTCSPVYAARIQSPEGYPVLRIYEWDRVKGFPWQIDFHLPPGSPHLYARMRIVNVHEREMLMYWWTNMTVDEIPGGRVLVPADEAITFRVGGRFGLERFQQRKPDLTYPTNNRNTNEFFAMIPDGHRPWIVAVDSKGEGFFQTSTRRLRGRKMFCWGQGQGGRHWQNVLSPGKPYVEIQAGLGRTQSHLVPMPARAEWTWLEAYGYFRADARKVHSRDWGKAWKTAGSVIDKQLPLRTLERLEKAFAPTSRTTPESILTRGSGWGALERSRLAALKRRDPIPAELLFDPSDMGPEQGPWLALLDTGSFPDAETDKDPMQGMVQPEWRKLLEKSLKAGPSRHWLAWLHVGNMRMEAFDVVGARDAWLRSAELAPSAWAYRNLAVLERREDNAEDACAYMSKAWEAGPRFAKLAIECAEMFAFFKQYRRLYDFCRGIPVGIRREERIRIYSAMAALKLRKYAEVERLFKQTFKTIHEGETVLTELWFSLHQHKVADREKLPMNRALRERVEKEFPPPASIDFRLAVDSG